MYDHSIPIFYITLRKEYLHFQQQNKINHKLTLEPSQAAVGPTSIFPSFLPYFSWPSHYPFKQSSHLHSSPHAWPALKHSQYFFLHCVFLQVHPFAPLVLLIAAVLIWTTYLASRSPGCDLRSSSILSMRTPQYTSFQMRNIRNTSWGILFSYTCNPPSSSLSAWQSWWFRDWHSRA